MCKRVIAAIARKNQSPCLGGSKPQGAHRSGITITVMRRRRARRAVEGGSGRLEVGGTPKATPRRSALSRFARRSECALIFKAAPTSLAENARWLACLCSRRAALGRDPLLGLAHVEPRRAPRHPAAPYRRHGSIARPILTAISARWRRRCTMTRACLSTRPSPGRGKRSGRVRRYGRGVIGLRLRRMPC